MGTPRHYGRRLSWTGRHEIDSGLLPIGIACEGGQRLVGGGASNSASISAVSVVIKGHAITGPIVSGNVTLYAMTDSGRSGAASFMTKTDAIRNYSLTTHCTVLLILAVTGASYILTISISINQPNRRLSAHRVGLQATPREFTVGGAIQQEFLIMRLDTYLIDNMILIFMAMIRNVPAFDRGRTYNDQT